VTGCRTPPWMVNPVPAVCHHHLHHSHQQQLLLLPCCHCLLLGSGVGITEHLWWPVPAAPSHRWEGLPTCTPAVVNRCSCSKQWQPTFPAPASSRAASLEDWPTAAPSAPRHLLLCQLLLLLPPPSLQLLLLWQRLRGFCCAFSIRAQGVRNCCEHAGCCQSCPVCNGGASGLLSAAWRSSWLRQLLSSRIEGSNSSIRADDIHSGT